MVYTPGMTVILAGLYDNGLGAIIITDKMRTGIHPITKEEHEVENDEVKKIFNLNKHVIVAFSGDVEFWADILDDISSEVSDKDSLRKVRKKIEKIYTYYYQRYQWSKIPGFYGFTSMKDYNKRAIQEMPQARIDQIDAQLKGILSPGEMVLVGVEDGSYKIYTLTDPGIFKPSLYGFAIAGSGMLSSAKYVAESYLMKFNKAQVQKILLSAKKLAEKDKGVGKKTEIVTLPG
jgi:20S proteasome alpha/beta subunit